MDKILAILGKLIPGLGSTGFGILGIANKASFLIAAGMVTWWLLGNRDEQVCLNYLELAGIIGIGAYGLEMNRKADSEK